MQEFLKVFRQKLEWQEVIADVIEWGHLKLKTIPLNINKWSYWVVKVVYGQLSARRLR